MLNSNMVPKFQEGEQVIAFDSEGNETHRGPLSFIRIGLFGSYVIGIGDQTVDISSYNKATLVSARHYDRQMAVDTLSEMSDVTDKYINHLRNELTDKEVSQAQTLIHELHAIMNHVAERVEKKAKRGVSIEYMQRMHGNHALDHDSIQKEIRTEIASSSVRPVRKVLEDLKGEAGDEVPLKPAKKGRTK